MIQKELKALTKELTALNKKVTKIQKALSNHQKEHQRHELRANKLKKGLQEKLAAIQTSVTSNIEAARIKETEIVPLLTKQLELKAQVTILEKVMAENKEK